MLDLTAHRRFLVSRKPNIAVTCDSQLFAKIAASKAIPNQENEDLGQGRGAAWAVDGWRTLVLGSVCSTMHGGVRGEREMLNAADCFRFVAFIFMQFISI